MQGLADLLRTQINYTAWASAHVLKTAASLPDDELNRDFRTSDHSILGTLVHVFAADRVWLGRLEGRPPAVFLEDSDRDFAVLQNEWPRLHARWKQWVSGIDDEIATAPLTYADLKGRPWTQPVWQVILHVVNHGTHHRGQVAGFLRAMGHAPPRLDFAVYCRETLT